MVLAPLANVTDAAFRRVQKPTNFQADTSQITESEIEVAESFLRRRWDLTERQRLSSEIRSLTAEARFSALIIMLLPIIMILLIRDSPLGETLFETPFGWGLLAAFAVVQVFVYLIIQRIAKIEV